MGCSKLTKQLDCTQDGKKVQCSDVGTCQKTSSKCVGDTVFETHRCLCPSKRSGKYCELTSKTKRHYNCGVKHSCGGRGICVLTGRNSTAHEETYGCECHEMFAGAHCHRRRAQMITQNTDGDLIPAMAGNGGYFP